MKFLAGNAFHMELLTMVLLWTIGNMVERQSSMAQQVRNSSKGSGDNDAEDYDVEDGDAEAATGKRQKV